jgi:hypothetical protein
VAAGPSAPAWVPDTIGNPAPYANLTFFDANGKVITGGSNLHDLFAYAVGNSPFNSNGTHHATEAELSFGTPNHSGNTSTWFASPQTSGSTFPITSGAPASLMSDTTTPVYTSDGANGFGSDLIDSLGVSDPMSGYVNLAQVRVYDTGLAVGTGSGSSYWEADVAFNTGTSPISVVVNTSTGYAVTVPAGSWVQVFPFVTSTTTTLSSPQVSPQPSGTQVTLNATVAPAENGTVTFFDGSTQVGSPQTVTTGHGAASVTNTPAVGSHSFTAVFTPTVGTQTNPNTNTATTVSGSTSTALPFTITTG